ncbi:MAG: diaminopimelate decarboxylase [Epsilonproteobacteria bacterium]|nr:diaminopimelate decarboxylase [Campylobacterota bacterium]
MKYKKPVINRIDFAISSKYGSPLHSQKIRTEIDGIGVHELVEQYGSPLFVFSQKRIKEQYMQLKQAFEDRYPKLKLSWSYKTNYLNAICKIYHQLGSGAEVVSEFEYDKALANNVTPSDIIYNGPYKPKEYLKKAILNNSKIHVDHLLELEDVQSIAQELDQVVNVAIRVNMDVGVYPNWNRFGFNYDNNEAYEAIKFIANSPYLNLNGLHTHIGTFILEANAYKIATIKLMKLRQQALEEFGMNVEYIDLGGGFASKNHLKGIYQSPEVVVPSVDEYAQAITNAIYEYNTSDELPTLYLETGRYLIDEAGYLLTSIQAYKRLPNGMKSYILDAGVNILYTSAWYNFNIEIDKDYDNLTEPSILNGPLCMNIDVINDNISLPPLERNSILTISPVGAYNITQSMQFIRYRPRVVLIDDDSNTRLIRQEDDLQSVMAKELE